MPGAPTPRAPEVSVLMPVRNAEATLDAAVESIRSQTFPSFEILLVDDHSTDSTPGHLNAWTEADPRIRTLACRGEGLIDALNTGLESARGPLVARMDADDLAHPHRLELQRAFFRTRGDLAVVSAMVESFPLESVREGYRIYERWLNALLEPDAIAREIFVESPLPHPSVLFHRDTIRDAGGYVDRGWPEDYELWLRLHHRGARFAKVPEVLHYWRDDPSRLSRVDPRYAVENFLRAKAHYLAIGPLRGQHVVVWGAGRIGRRLSRHLIREGARVDAFIDIDPRKIGRTLRQRPILSPEGLPDPGSVVVVAAVGSRNARALIRRRVASRFYVEGENFFCAA